MAEASSRKAARERPLSPHLQIYRPQINMVMSVFHRITGTALYFGSLLLAWWLFAAATGPDYFAFVNGLFATWPGMIVLVGFSWALIHHMLGGLRHLIWDTGRGFGPGEREWMARATLFGSITLTLLLWLFVYLVSGGLR